MRYIKLFEYGKKGPQIGDYVILKFKDEEDEDLIEFLEKNIGKIEFVSIDDYYRVEYKNMSNELKGILGYPIIAYDENVIFYAKRKQDVQDYLVAIKYNL